MIDRIDHIGIAVNSIDEALHFYRDRLGLRVASIEEIPTEGVRVAILPVGDSRIELLEPLDAESPLHKVLEKRGEGIHHLAFGTANLNKICDKIKVLGTPRKGAEGSQVAFVHPRDTHGVLVEFCQKRLTK